MEFSVPGSVRNIFGQPMVIQKITSQRIIDVLGCPSCLQLSAHTLQSKLQCIQDCC